MTEAGLELAVGINPAGLQPAPLPIRGTLSLIWYKVFSLFNCLNVESNHGLLNFTQLL